MISRLFFVNAIDLFFTITKFLRLLRPLVQETEFLRMTDGCLKIGTKAQTQNIGLYQFFFSTYNHKYTLVHNISVAKYVRVEKSKKRSIEAALRFYFSLKVSSVMQKGTYYVNSETEKKKCDQFDCTKMHSTSQQCPIAAYFIQERLVTKNGLINERIRRINTIPFKQFQTEIWHLLTEGFTVTQGLIFAVINSVHEADFP